MTAFFRSVFIALLVALTIAYACVALLSGYGRLGMVGAAFDARSGVVQSVVPFSPASRAGLRAGDGIDFARAGWPMHLWLNRGELLGGQTVALPILRSGRSFEVKVTGTLRASSRAQHVLAWIGASATMFYLLLGLLIYTMRRNAATFAFFAFCAGSGFGANTSVMWIAPPNWEPLATALATFQPVTGLYGFLYFGLLFGATQHLRGYQVLKRLWIPYFVVTVLQLRFREHRRQLLSHNTNI